MSEDQLEGLIIQVINGAVSTIPAYLEEIKENKETLKVENPQEFCIWNYHGHGTGHGRRNSKCTKRNTNRGRSNKDKRYRIQTHP